MESRTVNVVHASHRRAHRVALLRASLRLASIVAPPIAVRIAEDLFRTPPRYVRHEREMHLLSTATRSDLQFGNQRIAVWIRGEGPNVYFVHGWGGVGSQLSNLVEPIASAGFRVVMFDGPAHGESSGRLSSIMEFIFALRDVVDALGPAHAIVGHSMGCAATAVALHRGLDADRVAFLAPPSSPNHYLDQFTKILGIRPAIRDRMRRRFEEKWRFSWDELEVPAIAKSFTTPLLIVHDEEDREAPLSEAQAIATAWAGSTLVVTRGLGHRRILRDPAVVRRVASFVAGD